MENTVALHRSLAINTGFKHSQIVGHAVTIRSCMSGQSFDN